MSTHGGYIYRKEVNSSRVFISWRSREGSNPPELQVVIRPGGDLDQDEQTALNAFMMSLKRLAEATGSRIIDS